MILDHPNCFGRLQIVLVESKLFWSGPNHFGQVQIRLLCTNFYNLDPTKMIWTRPNQIGPDQNKLDSTKIKEGCNRLGNLQWTQPSLRRLQATSLLQPSLTKMIWMVQNHFGPIEGQGIWRLQFFQKTNLKALTFALAYWSRNFSFVFWKNSKHQKDISKLIDLYTELIFFTDTFFETFKIWLFVNLFFVLFEKRTDLFLFWEIFRRNKYI